MAVTYVVQLGGPPVDLGAWVESATRPSLSLQVKDAGNSALDITLATFTGVLRDRDTGLKVTLTTGSFSITTAASGIFAYAWATTDLATPGRYELEAILTLSTQKYLVRGLVAVTPKQA